MSFVDDFVPDEEKVEKLTRYTGAPGGTFSLKSLKDGEYIDVKFKSIVKVINEKTLQYNPKGGMSSTIEILSINGEKYSGVDMNLWLSDNLRISMAAELRKRKIPVTENAILQNIWRIFSVRNKKTPEKCKYCAELATNRYTDTSKQTETDTQAPGGVSAEDMFR